MSTKSKYDTETSSDFYGVRLTADPKVRKAGEKSLTTLAFVRGSKKGRYVDVWITADFPTDGRYSRSLAALKKGDIVTIVGPVHYRTYQAKDGARFEGEIPFPDRLVVHTDTRGRGQTEDADGGSSTGKSGLATSPEEDAVDAAADDFFGSAG
jgi:single-stranded DNA-binding protein